MNTIDCLVQQNEYHQVRVRGVTPAEAMLLRHMHDPTASRQAKLEPKDQQAKFWKVLSYAVAVGIAQTVVEPEVPALRDDATGKVLEKAIPAKTKERTDEEEIQRLRAKYHQRAKSGEAGTHVIDDLFPGMSARLPESFEDIGLDVAPPGSKPTANAGHGPQMAKRREMTTDEMVDELRKRGVSVGEPTADEAPPAPKPAKAPPAPKPAKAPRVRKPAQQSAKPSGEAA